MTSPTSGSECDPGSKVSPHLGGGGGGGGGGGWDRGREEANWGPFFQHMYKVCCIIMGCIDL